MFHVDRECRQYNLREKQIIWNLSDKMRGGLVCDGNLSIQSYEIPLMGCILC